MKYCFLFPEIQRKSFLQPLKIFQEKKALKRENEIYFVLDHWTVYGVCLCSGLTIADNQWTKMNSGHSSVVCVNHFNSACVKTFFKLKF